ncbi:MAG: hypothetical protein KDJ38_11835 [Gammaproteobacteria bacterium]|nr:hypothetical protein [Gammaproteobacteria bacterium]
MGKTGIPCIIDVEASGFGSRSYPIEVGFITPEGERYCSLIQPQPDWTHWDPRAEAIHNISRETLLATGRPAHEVANELNEQLQNTTAYSDGWVVDSPWLNALFAAAGLEMQFTLSPIEAILKEQDLARWDDTKARITLEQTIDRHRASHDAFLIQKTYCAVSQLR